MRSWGSLFGPRNSCPQRWASHRDGTLWKADKFSLNMLHQPWRQGVRWRAPPAAQLRSWLNMGLQARRKDTKFLLSRFLDDSFGEATCVSSALAMNTHLESSAPGDISLLQRSWRTAKLTAPFICFCPFEKPVTLFTQGIMRSERILRALGTPLVSSSLSALTQTSCAVPAPTFLWCWPALPRREGAGPWVPRLGKKPELKKELSFPVTSPWRYLWRTSLLIQGDSLSQQCEPVLRLK